MKVKYDLLFVTHLPSFYKVNLYNEIAKSCSVFVIFIANGSQIRTLDFTQNQCHFAYTILNTDSFEKRSTPQSLYQLIRQLRKIRYHKLIVGGWDLIEYWFLIFFSAKNKNAFALESSILDSRITGVKRFIKNMFLKRISLVFPSGKPHQALLEALSYSGAVKKTLGVGVFNYGQKTKLDRTFSGKFLYVGRFSVEKNLLQLVQIFNAYPQFNLTLIGDGPLSEQLKKIALPHILVQGHVPNEQLAKWYRTHDVFILPSLKEPWGLVVEEALYYGLPVIASNRVGCALDLVVGLQTGVLFDPHSAASLSQAILEVKKHYARFAKRVAALDFKTRDRHQIKQYVEASQ